MSIADDESMVIPYRKRVVAEYDYRDRDGVLLYQVVRYEPKHFRQRRPDGKGGWHYQLEDRRVPYRWPDLLKFPDGTVFVCKGEKDADNVAALDLCATTVASGKWTTECIEALAGRDVIILEDNDDAGRKRAVKVAQALHGTAKTVRVVSLPDLP
jgi:putative DNA primase/helicase